MKLSVVMITWNCADVVGEALESVREFASEILVSDQGSRDGTIEICKQYGAKVIIDRDTNLGRRKQRLIEKVGGPARNALARNASRIDASGSQREAGREWILVLDADERVSTELLEEIYRKVAIDKLTRPREFVNTTIADKNSIVGYKIQYQNYVFGKPVYFGGEQYAKVRLFRRGKGRVLETPLHEEIIVEGNIGKLNGKILHHSYRTPWQLFSKFTTYACIQAKQGGEVNARTLFLNGPHMFWARFVKEKGYKDGIHGFILALAFAYMEALQYWIACIWSLSSTVRRKNN